MYPKAGQSCAPAERAGCQICTPAFADTNSETERDCFGSNRPLSHVRDDFKTSVMRLSSSVSGGWDVRHLAIHNEQASPLDYAAVEAPRVAFHHSQARTMEDCRARGCRTAGTALPACFSGGGILRGWHEGIAFQFGRVCSDCPLDVMRDLSCALAQDRRHA